jgi:DNA-damage-inducible protein J
MKNAVVRARLENGLKRRAAAVLKANGLEISDAIRLFLRQVVQHGRLPFAPADPALVLTPEVRALKAQSQARDLAMAAQVGLPAFSTVMIRPHRLQGVRPIWPQGSLLKGAKG